MMRILLKLCVVSLYNLIAYADEDYKRQTFLVPPFNLSVFDVKEDVSKGSLPLIIEKTMDRYISSEFKNLYSSSKYRLDNVATTINSQTTTKINNPHDYRYHMEFWDSFLEKSEEEGNENNKKVDKSRNTIRDETATIETKFQMMVDVSFSSQPGSDIDENAASRFQTIFQDLTNFVSILKATNRRVFGYVSYAKINNFDPHTVTPYKDLSDSSSRATIGRNLGDCSDDKDWHDKDGPTYDCQWYAYVATEGKSPHRCNSFGDIYENFGKTANQACCACGGGTVNGANIQPSILVTFEDLTSTPTITSTDTLVVIPIPSPSQNPITLSTSNPTNLPTSKPTHYPTTLPSKTPTLPPTIQPTSNPTSEPTSAPTINPTTSPSTLHPSSDPTIEPTIVPTASPSPAPTNIPTYEHTDSPTMDPSTTPSDLPSIVLSNSPSAQPSAAMSSNPTIVPTDMPTTLPTAIPTITPTTSPTTQPTASPSLAPTNIPTDEPTDLPTVVTSTTPTDEPSEVLSMTPSAPPSAVVSSNPSIVPTDMPTTLPTDIPSIPPTTKPTDQPTPVIKVNYQQITKPPQPTSTPTNIPTDEPTNLPTIDPSTTPTDAPSVVLSTIPSAPPSVVASFNPSITPTDMPTTLPTDIPSIPPTSSPTDQPTPVIKVNFQPITKPPQSTSTPTNIPTDEPTNSPTVNPSKNPSGVPSIVLSMTPSAPPSFVLSSSPSIAPTDVPTHLHTDVPSIPPTASPTHQPTPVIKVNFQPITKPPQSTSTPTNIPTDEPTNSPTVNPSTTLTSIILSESPSIAPSTIPMLPPSIVDSTTPSISMTPTRIASEIPTTSANPSSLYSESPSESGYPSTHVSLNPSSNKSSEPSQEASTEIPSSSPSSMGSTVLSEVDSAIPSFADSVSPLPFGSMPSSRPIKPWKDTLPLPHQSSSPTGGEREHFALQNITLESINSNEVMDVITTDVYEFAARKFISENFPSHDSVITEITSVNVINQTLLSSRRYLQQQDAGTSDLFVNMEVFGDVLPGSPPDDYSFQDGVSYCFTNNYSGFVIMLIDSSSYFRDYIINPIERQQDTPPNANNGSKEAASIILYIALCVGGVAVITAILAIGSRRRVDTPYDVVQQDSWSFGFPSSVASPESSSFEVKGTSPRALEGGKVATRFNFDEVDQNATEPLEEALPVQVQSEENSDLKSEATSPPRYSEYLGSDLYPIPEAPSLETVSDRDSARDSSCRTEKCCPEQCFATTSSENGKFEAPGNNATRRKHNGSPRAGKHMLVDSILHFSSSESSNEDDERIMGLNVVKTDDEDDTTSSYGMSFAPEDAITPKQRNTST